MSGVWANLIKPKPAPAYKAVETAAETGRKGGDRDDSSRRQRAERKIKALNKVARARLAELEEAYNNAEEGSEEQAKADIGWYHTRDQWAQEYKKLAPDAGLKLTDEDQAWIDDAPKALAAAREKWVAPEAVDEEALPEATEVPKPEQGTPQAALPFSVQQQRLVDEVAAAEAEAKVIDDKLERIAGLRDGGEVHSTEDALLVASEDDLKEERAALGDRMEATRRAQQALGGGDEGVPGRSAAPTGAGHREAIRRMWHDTGSSTKALGPGAHLLTEPGVISLRRAKKEHVPESPAGHLFAPKPPGGATPEALAALKERRDALESVQDARNTELLDIQPRLDQWAEDIEFHRPRARDRLQQRVFDTLAARKVELTRLQEEDTPNLAQLQRGVSHMESVLSEQEQE